MHLTTHSVIRALFGLALLSFVLGTVCARAEEPEHDAGKRLFDIHCTHCHGLNGTGGAGPNLTDQTTVHGDGYYDVYDVILNGVRNKPMVSWRDRLTGPEIEQVTDYVFSLMNTRPDTNNPDKNYGYMF
jgi:mono/diheme cytochrome c family protein